MTLVFEGSSCAAATTKQRSLACPVLYEQIACFDFDDDPYNSEIALSTDPLVSCTKFATNEKEIRAAIIQKVIKVYTKTLSLCCQGDSRKVFA